MSIYFDHFPDIIYKKRKIKNISKKVSFIDEINEEMFLPLTLRDGEKAEDIAHYYYGDVSYATFILMMNKCYDWNYDWLMTEKQLYLFIFNKYKNISKMNNLDDVINWSKNVNIIDNILYFETVEGVKISKDTFLIDNIPKEYLNLKNTLSGQKTLLDNYLNLIAAKPVRIFEYEYKLNENKRIIYVIDKKYIKDVVSTFKEKIIK